VPVVVRLEGTNVEQGKACWPTADSTSSPRTTLTDAAKKAVAAGG
jgi:succinyl-CoA synthetase beta subunit